MKYEFAPKIDPKIKRFWTGAVIVTAMALVVWAVVGYFTGVWTPLLAALLFAPIGNIIDWYRFKSRNNIP